jgi:hypothetical protein
MRINEGSTEHKVLKAISRSQPPSSDYYSGKALDDLIKAGLVMPDKKKLTDEGDAALSRIRRYGIWRSRLGS